MLMGGGMDVPGGRVSTDPTGGDGGWDEHTGGLPGVRPAPGHRAQNAGLLRAARLPAAESAAASQSFDKLRRSHLRASPTASSKTITRFPRSSATPPSASSSGSGTSMASTAVTPSSRTTSVSTAASLVHELIEARDKRRLLNLQRQLSRLNLLIIDGLGFVPLSCTGRNCSSRFSASATSGDPSW